MVITIETVWLAVLGIAIVVALLDAFVITCAGEDKMLIFQVALGQWVALGAVGLVLSGILASSG